MCLHEKNSKLVEFRLISWLIRESIRVPLLTFKGTKNIYFSSVCIEMGVGGGGGHPQYIVDKYECTEYIPLRDGNFKRLNILHRLLFPAYIFFFTERGFSHYLLYRYCNTVLYCTVHIRTFSFDSKYFYNKHGRINLNKMIYLSIPPYFSWHFYSTDLVFTPM
jgi:hypothetical protein